ncbi:hypothetical protein E1263_40675 [Kribbella antibiotica]|uniref:Uncharacterized protein n=1 Tax=Kribbella antibiotica TaxID=190195 RepID=A0A4R4YHU2_9ACTN|nr:hypothetical protein [Kribbella antibiotica]TDD44435.1 hypothetical protein E1263_40675 [Kribbella antibiotica]
MLVSIEVPEYDVERGLTFEWDDGFVIEVDVSGTEVVVSANRAGLVSLARHLLVLAQDGVPSGHHVHLTADQEIESPVDLVLERRDAVLGG